MFLRHLLTMSGLLLSTVALHGAAADDLRAAARKGDTVKLVRALAAGASADSADRDGSTALMLATKAGSFACVRELLWAKADPALKNKKGEIARDLLPEETDNAERQPLEMLLRCYAFMRVQAKVAPKPPAHPEEVLIMEDVVNYLHPDLAKAYAVNVRERDGKPGIDDDGDGFVDNVYGWNPMTDKPYAIRKEQLAIYQSNRDAIVRILKIDSERATGVITRDEAELKLAEYTNPLAQIMGPLDGLNDASFLGMLKSAAHGSHVAGIIMASSEGKARLQTLAVDFSESTRRPLGKDTDRLTHDLLAKPGSLDSVLGGYREALLQAGVVRGRLCSRYLQASGAGVVNMSFGGGLGFYRQRAAQLVRGWAGQRQSEDDSFAFSDEEMESAVDHWSLELYTAGVIEFAMLFAENPQVLFLAAAGNENENVDETWTNPAFMARFFPNVMAIGACGASDAISSFSNFGILSVDLCAPGEDILSTVIPEAALYMDGTSMATPCVAGVAALMRTLKPDISPGALRQAMVYTSREVPGHRRYTSSSGIIDAAMLKAYLVGSGQARAAALARVAGNAVRLNDELYPTSSADALTLSAEAVKLDPGNADAWFARARALWLAEKREEAMTTMAKAIAMHGSADGWMMVQASMLRDAGRIAEARAAITASLALLSKAGMAESGTAAVRLAERATLDLQDGDSEAAKTDAQAARAINEDVELEDEVAALLVE